MHGVARAFPSTIDADATSSGRCAEPPGNSPASPSVRRTRFRSARSCSRCFLRGRVKRPKASHLRLSSERGRAGRGDRSFDQKTLGRAQNVSYHSAVADTAHCSYKTEYTDLLTASIAAFLKHTGAPPGQIKAATGSGGQVNRADWIDWTAPTLP